MKCPICNSKTSPRRGERLQKFPHALRAMDYNSKVAHTSCLIRALKVATRKLETKGSPLPVANRNPSQLLNSLEQSK